MTSTARAPFGAALRRWRGLRGMSQLELSLVARTTTRHLSYLETGRSRPSAEMVDRLCNALHLPLRERNNLFRAAGLAAAYSEHDLSDQQLEPFLKCVELMLASHAPYPAFAIDGHWNIVRANETANRFLPPEAERNVVQLMYGGAWRELVVNWPDVAWVGVQRLQAEAARFPHDDVLAGLAQFAEEASREAPRPTLDSPTLVLCPHFALGGQIVKTISVVAQFGSALDITLEELRIELIYPADAAAEAFFGSLAQR